MSISFSVYFNEPKSISREELASRCRERHWLVLVHESSDSESGEQFAPPTGSLSDGDRFYGADARTVSKHELEAALREDRMDVLWNASGGEAIICINSEFDVDNIYDEESLDELSKTNAEFVERLRSSRIHVEILGGAQFVYELSMDLARIGKGIWEDPQSGDCETM